MQPRSSIRQRLICSLGIAFRIFTSSESVLVKQFFSSFFLVHSKILVCMSHKTTIKTKRGAHTKLPNERGKKTERTKRTEMINALKFVGGKCVSAVHSVSRYHVSMVICFVRRLILSPPFELEHTNSNSTGQRTAKRFFVYREMNDTKCSSLNIRHIIVLSAALLVRRLCVLDKSDRVAPKWR